MVIRSVGMKLLLSLSLFFPFAASAGHILSITATTPFPATVSTSSTTTAIFQVTNNASRISVIAVNQSQLPTELSVASSTCGNLMAPGQSCSVAMQLRAPNTEQTISSALRMRASPSIDGVQFPFSVRVIASPTPQQQFTVTPSAGTGGSIAPNTAQTVNSGGSVTFTATPDANFGVNQWLLDGSLAQTGGTSYTLSSITANHTVQVTFSSLFSFFTAVGNGLGDAMIVTSEDSGATFTNITDLNFTTASTFLYAASCTNGGTNPICAAVGENNLPGGGGIIAMRTNATTWTGATVSSDVPGRKYLSASCTGTDTTAICAAAGIEDPAAPPPLVVSRDAGTTWNTINTSVVTEGRFNGVSCTGSEANAYCAAVGNNTTAGGPAIIFASQDGGVTWTNQTITDIPGSDDGTFNSVSCTGETTAIFCAAVGESSQGNPSFLAVTQPIAGGFQWSLKTIPGIDAGSFNSVSCTGSGTTALCTAAGRTLTSAPLIAVSNDGGDTWAQRTISGTAPTTGVFNSASCSGGPSGICVAAGTDQTALLPIVAMSNDNGATWAYQTITNQVSQGRLNSVTCSTNSADTTTCVAGGSNTSTGEPVLVIGTNNGTTWTVLAFETIGEFSGTGSTPSLFSNQKKFGAKEALKQLIK